MFTTASTSAIDGRSFLMIYGALCAAALPAVALTWHRAPGARADLRRNPAGTECALAAALFGVAAIWLAAPDIASALGVEREGRPLGGGRSGGCGGGGGCGSGCGGCGGCG